MAQMIVSIPNKVLQTLQQKMQPAPTAAHLLEEAMTMFAWAVQERAQGREILSCRRDGQEVKRLSMTSLDGIV